VPTTAAPGAIAAIDVPLIEWPAAEALRERLAAEGRPRLLVVDAESAPPTCLDELEDWVRHPVDTMDVVARTATLRRRAARGLLGGRGERGQRRLGAPGGDSGRGASHP
jgi:hypothetical protein